MWSMQDVKPQGDVWWPCTSLKPTVRQTFVFLFLSLCHPLPQLDMSKEIMSFPLSLFLNQSYILHVHHCNPFSLLTLDVLKVQFFLYENMHAIPYLCPTTPQGILAERRWRWSSCVIFMGKKVQEHICLCKHAYLMNIYCMSYTERMLCFLIRRQRLPDWESQYCIVAVSGVYGE